MFMTAAAELAGGATAPMPLPVWERERYRSRVPPRVTFTHHEYMHVDDPPPRPTSEPWSLHSSFFTKADVAALRAQLPADLRKSATSFEVITACMWRCRVSALQYAPDEVARLIIAVNSRTKFVPPLTGYYGNSLMLPAVVTEAGKLVGSDLGYAVELVREAKGKVTEEYVRSAADFLVLNGRVHFVVNNTYLVSDLRRLVDLGNMDWGWGKAVSGGPVDVGENLISFLGTSKNSAGEEGAVVPFCLPDSALGRFKSEVKKMVSFRPLENAAASNPDHGYMSRM